MTSVIKRLARAGHVDARRVMDAFNPDQPRDEHGRWDDGEGNAIVSGQRAHIERMYGKKAAGEADYAKVSNGPHSVSTKVYTDEGTKYLTTVANPKTQTLEHKWED